MINTTVTTTDKGLFRTQGKMCLPSSSTALLRSMSQSSIHSQPSGSSSSSRPVVGSPFCQKNIWYNIIKFFNRWWISYSCSVTKFILCSPTKGMTANLTSLTKSRGSELSKVTVYRNCLHSSIPKISKSRKCFGSCYIPHQHKGWLLDPSNLQESWLHIHRHLQGKLSDQHQHQTTYCNN